MVDERMVEAIGPSISHEMSAMYLIFNSGFCKSCIDRRLDAHLSYNYLGITLNNKIGQGQDE